eukprot:scaffold4488_cov358-Prasinococcus_capsulatus_cf.AAC.13
MLSTNGRLKLWNMVPRAASVYGVPIRCFSCAAGHQCPCRASAWVKLDGAGRLAGFFSPRLHHPAEHLVVLEAQAPRLAHMHSPGAWVFSRRASPSIERQPPRPGVVVRAASHDGPWTKLQIKCSTSPTCRSLPPRPCTAGAQPPGGCRRGDSLATPGAAPLRPRQLTRGGSQRCRSSRRVARRARPPRSAGLAADRVQVVRCVGVGSQLRPPRGASHRRGAAAAQQRSYCSRRRWSTLAGAAPPARTYTCLASDAHAWRASGQAAAAATARAAPRAAPPQEEGQRAGKKSTRAAAEPRKVGGLALRRGWSWHFVAVSQSLAPAPTLPSSHTPHSSCWTPHGVLPLPSPPPPRRRCGRRRRRRCRCRYRCRCRCRCARRPKPQSPRPDGHPSAGWCRPRHACAVAAAVFSASLSISL